MKKFEIKLGGKNLLVSYDTRLVPTGKSCSTCLMPLDEMDVEIHEVLDAEKMIDVQLDSAQVEMIRTGTSEDFEEHMKKLYTQDGTSICPDCGRPDGREAYEMDLGFLDLDQEEGTSTEYVAENSVNKSDPCK